MERKIIKIVDEHGIDRDASIVCSIDVDGSDYVFYFIGRDEENDNIFVSKLINNIDGTSSMINIDDSSEKSKISDIVKGLIKYAIDNEKENLVDKKVVINGKSVEIGSVLINKEQYINVQKTYITTVKKSVTKVSSDFYILKENNPFTDNIFTDIPSNDVVLDSVPVTPAPVVVPEIVEPITTQNSESVPVDVLPSVEVPAVETPALPIEPTIVEPISEPVSAPVNNDAFAGIPDLLSPEPVSVSEPVSAVEPINSVPTPPVAPVPEPVAVTPAPVTVEPTATNNTLVFDASKESNLNAALGEVSTASTLPVNDLNSVRDFGSDTTSTMPVNNPLSNNQTTVVNQTNSAGFANNKFFMVVAIAFFVASCMFLGYEVYHYFMVK